MSMQSNRSDRTGLSGSLVWNATNKVLFPECDF